MQRRPLVGFAFACLFCLGPVGQPSSQSPNPVVAASAPPMLAVAHLVTDDKWSNVLDELVQETPAAASLGVRWAPSNRAWQEVRKILAVRVTRILDAYARSGELERLLETELAGMGKDAEALGAALGGPSGATILRGLASMQFVSARMTADPNGPQPGQPEWMERIRTLSRRFDERAGAAVPLADPAHGREAEQFLSSDLGRRSAQLWMAVVEKATIQLDTAINLTLFDDRAAMDREIANVLAKAR